MSGIFGNLSSPQVKAQDFVRRVAQAISTASRGGPFAANDMQEALKAFGAYADAVEMEFTTLRQRIERLERGAQPPGGTPGAAPGAGSP